jgi:hypothetical protein
MEDSNGLYEGNEAEKRYCGASGSFFNKAKNGLQHGHQCRVARNTASQAVSETAARYGEAWGDHTAGGAFRHCYWSGLMTLYLGKDKAKKFGDLHESDDPDSRAAQFDYFNNNVGRLYGEYYRNNISDLGLAERLIADACAQGSFDGRLVTDINDPRLDRTDD